LTELTPELLARIVDLVRSGSYVDIALLSCGVDMETQKQWMELAEGNNKSIYYQLREGIKRAEAEAEARNVAIVQRAAGEDWRAAQWWLENHYPSRWARQKIMKGLLG